MNAPDEHVHDGKSLPELLENIIKTNKIIGKLFIVDDNYEAILFQDIYPQIKGACLASK